MKLNSENSIIEAAQLALLGISQEESVRLQMEAFGLNQERQDEGRLLLQKATDCQKKQMECYDAQWSLSQQLNAKIIAVEVQFKDHARVARSAYRKKPDLLHVLKIDRFANRGWESIRQAHYFYSRLQERDLNLQSYGISKKEIEQASNEVNLILKMREERIHKKGITENCTEEKQEAFKALRQWVSSFRTIARLAFKDSPQLLESFGIYVPSGAKY